MLCPVCMGEIARIPDNSSTIIAFAHYVSTKEKGCYKCNECGVTMMINNSSKNDAVELEKKESKEFEKKIKAKVGCVR